MCVGRVPFCPCRGSTSFLQARLLSAGRWDRIEFHSRVRGADARSLPESARRTFSPTVEDDPPGCRFYRPRPPGSDATLLTSITPSLTISGGNGMSREELNALIKCPIDWISETGEEEGAVSILQYDWYHCLNEHAVSADEHVTDLGGFDHEEARPGPVEASDR